MFMWLCAVPSICFHSCSMFYLKRNGTIKNALSNFIFGTAKGQPSLCAEGDFLPFGKRHKPPTLFTHIPAVRLSTVSSGVRQALRLRGGSNSRDCAMHRLRLSIRIEPLP